jgi:putative hydrolase of the HAD superfamily
MQGENRTRDFPLFLRRGRFAAAIFFIGKRRRLWYNEGETAEKKGRTHAMIHNVVFDMGKVLLDFNVERYLLHVEREEDRPLVRHALFESAEWTMTDYGIMDDERLIAAACRRLPQHLHPAAAEIVHTWYRDMPAYPGIGEVIRGLKDEGYRLYLLSNVSGHYEVMRRNIPHIERFDGEFISSDWHLLKPDPEIFRVFCLHFGLNPAQCFFIDDQPANVFGAMRAGMRGMVYHGDPGEIRPELEAAQSAR